MDVAARKVVQARSPGGTLQDCELMSLGKVLEDQFAARAQARDGSAQ